MISMKPYDVSLLNKKNKEYWNERHFDWIRSQTASDESALLNMKVHFAQANQEIVKEIRAFYKEYEHDNVVQYRRLMKFLPEEDVRKLITDYDTFFKENPNYAHLLPVRESIYKLNRMEGLEHSFTMELNRLGVFNEQYLHSHLNYSLDINYRKIMKEIGHGNAFDAINVDIARTIMGRKWINNHNFSDVIWKDTEKLTDFLKNDFRDALIRGDSYEKMVKKIRERFDVAESNVKRLIWTESSFVLNQAHLLAYEQYGAKAYEINAIIDKRTSEVCEIMDGQAFLFSEITVGTNFPPFHPYCRSTFIMTDKLDGEIENVEPERERTEEEIRQDLMDNIMDRSGKAFDRLEKSESYADELKEILKDVSDDDLMVLNQLANGLSDDNLAYRGGAHYDPSGKRINMLMTDNIDERYRKNGRTGAFNTFFHEEFHKLDYLLSNSPLSETIGQSPLTFALSSTRTKSGVEMSNAVKRDVLNLFNKASSTGKTIENMDRLSAQSKRDMLRFLNNLAPNDKRKSEIGFITDAIGGATNGRVDTYRNGFFAHPAGYYKGMGDNVAGLEAWAEYGVYRFASTKEQKDLIKEHMPETIKLFDSMYLDIAKYFAEGNRLGIAPRK